MRIFPSSSTSIVFVAYFSSSARFLNRAMNRFWISRFSVKVEGGCYVRWDSSDTSVPTVLSGTTVTPVPVAWSSMGTKVEFSRHRLSYCHCLSPQWGSSKPPQSLRNIFYPPQSPVKVVLTTPVPYKTFSTHPSPL